jgi:hypothetical protein
VSIDIYFITGINERGFVNNKGMEFDQRLNRRKAARIIPGSRGGMRRCKSEDREQIYQAVERRNIPYSGSK